MNYVELKAAVQFYLETSEAGFVANLPVFVRQVENRIYNAVHLPALRKSVKGVMTKGSNYLATPADFLAAFSLSVVNTATGDYDYARFVDVDLVREAYPTPSNRGMPRMYALFDPTTFILGPTPDENYGAELHYFYYPESIVTAGTSWVGTNFESVLLYGTIAEGYRALKGNPEQQKIYDEQYAESLSLLRKLVEGRDRGDAYRDREPKLKIS